MKIKKRFIDDYRISFVFGFQDPFVEDDLRSLLKKRKFKVETKSRIIEAPPFRAVRTDVAKKGNVSVLYDNEISYVGVAGQSFKEVRANFAILGRILKELDPITYSKQRSVELIFKGRVWTKKDPQKTITNFMKTEKMDLFKNIFEKGIRPFTVRVVTEDHRIKDNPNWFSLRIEPLIRNPRYYFLELVYRNEDVSMTLKIADKIEEIIASSIETIEGK